MPLRLNIGLSKKVGLPDYGSLGASCNVEVELDGSMLQNDLDGFHRHVRSAFTACRQAVHDELAHSQGASQETSPADKPDTNGTKASHGTNGDQRQNGRNGNGHRASHKQLDYAQQLAGQIRGMGVRRLESLATKIYSKPLADLSSLDASGLIDVLKDIKEGKIELSAALNGAAS